MSLAISKSSASSVNVVTANHQYPAHAAFGGYKSSGVGREHHKMMLDHYSQTKCLPVSYDPHALGFY